MTAEGQRPPKSDFPDWRYEPVIALGLRLSHMTVAVSRACDLPAELEKLNMLNLTATLQRLESLESRGSTIGASKGLGRRSPSEYAHHHSCGSCHPKTGTRGNSSVIGLLFVLLISLDCRLIMGCGCICLAPSCSGVQAEEVPVETWQISRSCTRVVTCFRAYLFPLL